MNPAKKSLHALLLTLAVGSASAQTPSAPAALPDAPSAVAHVEPPAVPTGPTVVFDTTMGRLVCKLFSDQAPITVANFIGLANGSKTWTDPITLAKVSGKPFYDGTTFHRVIPGFMIQGGCPEGTGTGGPGYQIKAEFNRRPDRKHTRGVLSMARSQNPDSAGSQFFIMHQDSPHLDGQYSAFGKVTSGIEVVDKIVSVPAGPSDRPKNPPKIIKITVTE